MLKVTAIFESFEKAPERALTVYKMECKDVSYSGGSTLRGRLTVAAGGLCKNPIESRKPIPGSLNMNTLSLNSTLVEENGFDCSKCPVMINCDQITDYAFSALIKNNHNEILAKQIVIFQLGKQPSMLYHRNSKVKEFNINYDHCRTVSFIL